MKLEGIHHITAITAEAQSNVDFYVGVMGLRLVKKSINQDHTSVYHLFYGDEKGDPGADLTFFEYPGAPPGRAGAGMVHVIGWRLGTQEAVPFWAKRLEAQGLAVDATEEAVSFADPEGLRHELKVVETDDEPLIADHPEIPKELALQGFDSARAYSSAPGDSRALLEETLGFDSRGEAEWEARGERRGGLWAYDDPPEEPGLQGAGSVHHIAWASTVDDHEAWHERLVEAGEHPTQIIDRFYFRSIYFREPSGVLFEIATMGPGFTVDEPLESLGEKLSVTPQYEPMREQIEAGLKPIVNPRTVAA
jgi:glyoxalase family protein